MTGYCEDGQLHFSNALAENAKANDLEPYDYLLHVLKHIASAGTIEKLEALLPWNMKQQNVQ